MHYLIRDSLVIYILLKTFKTDYNVNLFFIINYYVMYFVLLVKNILLLEKRWKYMKWRIESFVFFLFNFMLLYMSSYETDYMYFNNIMQCFLYFYIFIINNKHKFIFKSWISKHIYQHNLNQIEPEHK